MPVVGRFRGRWCFMRRSFREDLCTPRCFPNMSIKWPSAIVKFFPEGGDRAPAA